MIELYGVIVAVLPLLPLTLPLILCLKLLKEGDKKCLLIIALLCLYCSAIFHIILKYTRSITIPALTEVVFTAMIMFGYLLIVVLILYTRLLRGE